MEIFVWSDYACPFCWIGEARLRKAIKETGIDAVMHPAAFELNPAAPKQTDLTGLETIASRYGMTPRQAKAEFDKIAAMAREDGIELRQNRTQHTNTFDAHRLMKMGLSTADMPLAMKLNELLFAGFFVDNLNLADHHILQDIGMKGGLNELMIKAMLESDQFAKDVRADELEAERRGVRGGPYFVFENGAAASGALPVKEFVTILKSADELSASGAPQCVPDGCQIAPQRL